MRYFILLVSINFVMSYGIFADWQTPVNMGPVINNSLDDFSPYISMDETHLYYAKGPIGNRDIFVSEFRNGQWQPPINLGPNINSSYDDRDPTVIGDSMIIFASDRPSRYSGWPFHLWYSRKSGSGWTPAQLVGDPIGSNYGDETPWMIWEGPDTLLLFFCSQNRPGGLGGWDIWQARQISGIWQTPTNIGPPVNTSGLESSPNIWVSFVDGLDSIRMYYVSDFGCFYSDRIRGIWRTPVRLPDIINNGGVDRPSITPDDSTLYFSSWRPGGYGERDIWYSVNSGPQGVEGQISQIKSKAKQFLIRPNPSSEKVEINYYLQGDGDIALRVYDVMGREIRTLLQMHQTVGSHRIVWDGKDDYGKEVPEGIYFITLSRSGENLIKKVVIAR